MLISHRGLRCYFSWVINYAGRIVTAYLGSSIRYRSGSGWLPLITCENTEDCEREFSATAPRCDSGSFAELIG